MKFDKSKMDVENLDELIGMCEDKMVSPFKKKKAAMVAVVSPEGESEGEGEGEMMAEGEEKKPDLSEMDLEDLLEMYKGMKEG
jgi:hypothetical protein